MAFPLLCSFSYSPSLPPFNFFSQDPQGLYFTVIQKNKQYNELRSVKLLPFALTLSLAEMRSRGRVAWKNASLVQWPFPSSLLMNLSSVLLIWEFLWRAGGEGEGQSSPASSLQKCSVLMVQRKGKHVLSFFSISSHEGKCLSNTVEINLCPKEYLLMGLLISYSY